MDKVETIEKDIEHLDDKAFARLRAWFIEYDNARWDRQIEVDSNSGDLDALVDEAMADHRSGKSTQQVLLDRSFFALDQKRYQKFIELLDAPPNANARLMRLLATKAPWEA